MTGGRGSHDSNGAGTRLDDPVAAGRQKTDGVSSGCFDPSLGGFYQNRATVSSVWCLDYIIAMLCIQRNRVYAQETT